MLPDNPHLACATEGALNGCSWSNLIFTATSCSSQRLAAANSFSMQAEDGCFVLMCIQHPTAWPKTSDAGSLDCQPRGHHRLTRGFELHSQLGPRVCSSSAQASCRYWLRVAGRLVGLGDCLPHDHGRCALCNHHCGCASLSTCSRGIPFWNLTCSHACSRH